MRRFIATLLGLVTALSLGAPVAADQFPDRIDLPDGWRPEGITSGTGTTIYAGSLATGSIWRGDTRTGEGDPAFIVETGLTAVGLDYESGSDRLWVAGGPTSQVRVYDATSGDLLETYVFPGSGFLNDVVVTRDAVYVTDSNNAQLIVIPLGSGGELPPPSDATTLPLTGDIVVDPAAFNANGIVALRGWLILVQSNTGLLFRVDPATGETTAIDLGGESVTTGDGLELRGSTLYVVRNQMNIVAVFRLGPGLTSASLRTELESADFDVPTTATLSAGDLWAVNARFGTPPTPDTEYWITRVPGS
jgi:hypothetical protein